MCGNCGCVATDLSARRHSNVRVAQHVDILSSLLSGNDRDAALNRRTFDFHGVMVVNLMSSPGAGKTSLLEATVERLAGHYRFAVIEGDLETENDALRLRKKGIQAIQITTGTACHLDAQMIRDAVQQIDLSQLDILFIENVGNLVCPASFDLGQHRNVVLLATTEGDDKPQKYPVMFRAADLVCLTKTDLLTVLDDFDPEAAKRHVQNLASAAPVLEVSSKNKLGIDAWAAWIGAQRGALQDLARQGKTLYPNSHRQASIKVIQNESTSEPQRVAVVGSD